MDKQLYEGPVPVTEDWVEEHEGEYWAIQYVTSFDDIIDVNGMREMNDLADAITGVVLEDVSHDPVSLLENGKLLMEVSGNVVRF